MTDLPQILRNNASWLKDRGSFPKAVEACEAAADEIERLRKMYEAQSHIIEHDEKKERQYQIEIARLQECIRHGS